MLWKNKNNYETLFKEYVSQKLLVDRIEQNFGTLKTLGDIEKYSKTIESRNEQLFIIKTLEQEQSDFPIVDKYDIKNDLMHNMLTIKHITSSNNSFKSTKQPHIMRKEEYHEIREKLNKDQQSVIKEIIMRKENEPITAIHLFLNGGAGIGKNIIEK